MIWDVILTIAVIVLVCDVTSLNQHYAARIIDLSARIAELEWQLGNRSAHK